MLTKTNFWRTAALALLLLNGCLLAFFLTRPRPPREGGPQKIIVERLHFDAAQIGAYEQLMQQHRSEVQTKRREVQAAKQQLYGLLQGSDFSKKDSLARRVGQLQVDIENVHFSHFQDIKSLCKSDQIENFNALTGELSQFFAPPGRRQN
ncbi:MAG: Spy/CpxP family protein refolding chaperone [Saprospiraceae bacterium]